VFRKKISESTTCRKYGFEWKKMVPVILADRSQYIEMLWSLSGIWADEDSDDERPGFANRRRGKDYTAPVGFVSAGIKEGQKPSGSKDGDDEDDESFKDDGGTSSVRKQLDYMYNSHFWLTCREPMQSRGICHRRLLAGHVL
jgi:hypothetical protein